MESLLGLLILLATFLVMEGVALVTHRYVMHGFLWSLHKSHHEPREGRFEKNDWFAVMFAAPSIVFIFLGMNVFWPFLWVGLGMTAYGLMYFIFHDVIVHQRIRFRQIPRFGYLRHIVQAHRLHHAVDSKHGAVSFGFLYAPPLAGLRSAVKQARG